MNHNFWTHQLTDPLAIAVGVLACFWGYRMVKVILGIMGFAGGFVGGWMPGSARRPCVARLECLCEYDPFPNAGSIDRHLWDVAVLGPRAYAANTGCPIGRARWVGLFVIAVPGHEYLAKLTLGHTGPL